MAGQGLICMLQLEGPTQSHASFWHHFGRNHFSLFSTTGHAGLVMVVGINIFCLCTYTLFSIYWCILYSKSASTNNRDAGHHPHEDMKNPSNHCNPCK
jgi:hypothetical protein